MSGSKPPKHEFNPRAHAMVYMLAMVYLAYLIFQMVQGYLAGGSDAPSFPLLIGGAAVLGGGCVFLGVLARKMSVMAGKKGRRRNSTMHSGKQGNPRQEERRKDRRRQKRNCKKMYGNCWRSWIIFRYKEEISEKFLALFTVMC